jgi:hypothetical protein
MNHRQRSLARRANELHPVSIEKRFLPGKSDAAKTTAAQRDDIDRANSNASDDRPTNVQ